MMSDHRWEVCVQTTGVAPNSTLKGMASSLPDLFLLTMSLGSVAMLLLGDVLRSRI